MRIRLTIGQKLTLAFGAALVILVATGIVASRATRELSNTVDRITDTRFVTAAQSASAPNDFEARNLARREAADAIAGARRASLIVRFGLLITLIMAPLAFLILRNDFVQIREAESALRDSEARFRAAADGSLDAFYVLRAIRDVGGHVADFEFVDLNAKAEELFGRSRSQILGQRLRALISANRRDGYFEKYVHVLEQQRVWEDEFEVHAPGVRAAWIHQQVVPLSDGVAISSRDVSERKRQEEALRSLSLVDELTGLYNRRGFLTLAQQHLKLAKRGHRELLLLFVDMDDFKDINDNFGHAEGDAALVRASQILRKTFRDSDILARLGGDEFVVLASDPGAGTTDLIIDRLRSELLDRNARDGRPYRLSLSVGVARFDPISPPSIEELLATADRMLYEQKRHKRQDALIAS